MISLRTFGTIGLEVSGGSEPPTVLSHPKRLAILAHLATVPGEFRRRDIVLAMFWPEMDDKQTHQSHPESLVPDNGAVLAAIGFVLHSEVQKQLAAEDTSAGKR